MNRNLAFFKASTEQNLWFDVDMGGFYIKMSVPRSSSRRFYPEVGAVDGGVTLAVERRPGQVLELFLTPEDAALIKVL